MTLTDFFAKAGLPTNMEKILRILENNYDGGELTVSTQQLNSGFGAKYQGLDRTTHNALIYLPPIDQNGRVPVKSIDGKITYVMYDSSFALVHETNHLILDLLGLNGIGDNEIAIAIMARAVEEALKQGTDKEIETRLKELLNDGDTVWLDTFGKTKQVSAQEYNASFENMHSLSSGFLKYSGLSNTSDLYRKGYGQFGNWETGTGALKDAFDAGFSFLGNKEHNTLWGGMESDYLDGGAGNDILYGDNDELNNTTDLDHTSKDGGKDTIIGGEGNDYLYGGGGNDTLYGDKVNEIFSDASGSDNLYGGSGDDTLFGGSGNDKIYGGADDDTLYGSTSASVDDNAWDILQGGAGIDTYYTGDDDYIYDSDNKGKVYFNGQKLGNVRWDAERQNYYDSYDNKYTRGGSNSLFVTSRNGESLQISGFFLDYAGGNYNGSLFQDQ